MKYISVLLVGLVANSTHGMEIETYKGDGAGDRKGNEFTLNAQMMPKEVRHPSYYHVTLKNETPITIEVRLAQKFADRGDKYHVNGVSDWHSILAGNIFWTKHFVSYVSDRSTVDSASTTPSVDVRFGLTYNCLSVRHATHTKDDIVRVVPITGTGEIVCRQQLKDNQLHLEYSKVQ
jgi:hypothetical protein